jgi:hypothetical protein
MLQAGKPVQRSGSPSGASAYDWGKGVESFKISLIEVKIFQHFPFFPLPFPQDCSWVLRPKGNLKTTHLFVGVLNPRTMRKNNVLLIDK